MHPLSSDDMHLLWRFRYSLTTDRQALTKFLRSVDWTDAEVCMGHQCVEVSLYSSTTVSHELLINLFCSLGWIDTETGRKSKRVLRN